MAKVSIRKDELDLVLETARRAAERTNSVVVIAEDRLELTEESVDRADQSKSGKSVSQFN